VSARGPTVKAMVAIARPRDGALLVSEHSDPNNPFHRLPGGHVELGEQAVDTVHRELGEELGQILTGVALLGVLENVFRWRGRLAHEVVFVYRAGFADAAAYDIEEQRIRDEPEQRTRVIWRPAGAAGPPLYPDGTAELLAGSSPSGAAVTG
jgi:ADP-ribose pyrophosphatase YjhB (NUDIX family)